MNTTALPDPAKDRAEAKLQADTVALASLAGPAAIGIGIYAAAEGSWSIFALSALIAACAFALGSLLGFLFGIPLYIAKGGEAQPNPTKPTYQPNTNLTQVSDWLTKIIIGVGLVEFGQLTDTIGRLGDSLESSLGGTPTGKVFGIALVVGFFVIGFLVGYLFTRLRLQWAFTAADRGAFEVAEEVVEKKFEQQGEADAQVLKLGSDPTGAQPPEEELKEVLAKASSAALAQAQIQAQEKAKPGQPLSDRARTLLEAIDEIIRERS